MHQTSTIADVLLPKERYKVLHVPGMNASESLRDHQHIGCARYGVKTSWLLPKKIQQALVLQRQFSAFARTMTEGAWLYLRNKSFGSVVFAGLLSSLLRGEVLVLFFIDL